MGKATLPVLGAVVGTVIAPGIGTAIGAGLGVAANGMSGGKVDAPPPPPAPAPPTPMPSADDAGIMAAKKKQLAADEARTGRMSTIMSTGGTNDKLGS